MFLLMPHVYAVVQTCCKHDLYFIKLNVMSKPIKTKLSAFIVTLTALGALPQLCSAQKYKPCPQHYKQECYYYTCPLCARGTWTCYCVPNGTGNNTSYNATSRQSIATSFELEQPSTVSIKIYDATGRMIKTLGKSRMLQGEHQIEWDKKDEQGNAVGAGIYILQFDAGTFSDRKKLTVI
jgi:flagellar hook capping protein FlgD